VGIRRGVNSNRDVRLRFVKILVAVAGLMLVLSACAGNDARTQKTTTTTPPAGTPATTTTASEPKCIKEVRRSTTGLPDTSPMAVADNLVVTAVTKSGCAPLDARLVAINWFSLDNRNAYLDYATSVTKILVSRGHWPVIGARTVGTLEAPKGTPATGGAYVHDEFAFPVYSSASGLLDMLLSPEYQAIVKNQQAGARQSDYVWGLQKCYVGCYEKRPEPVQEGFFVLHVFNRPNGDLGQALQALAHAPDSPDVFYGGALVAILQIEVGGKLINPQKRPWGNGTAVYRVKSVEAARALMKNKALVACRKGTTNDMLAVVEAGLGG
jgi:hypothetical protein